jgi:hypothetical protein
MCVSPSHAFSISFSVLKAQNWHWKRMQRGNAHPKRKCNRPLSWKFEIKTTALQITQKVTTLSSMERAPPPSTFLVTFLRRPPSLKFPALAASARLYAVMRVARCLSTAPLPYDPFPRFTKKWCLHLFVQLGTLAPNKMILDIVLGNGRRIQTSWQAGRQAFAAEQWQFSGCWFVFKTQSRSQTWLCRADQ